MRRQVVTVRMLFALVSVTSVLANSTNPTEVISTSDLVVSGTTISNISSSTNDHSTTTSVHPSTISGSSTAHSSSASTSAAPASPSNRVTPPGSTSTVTTPAGPTTVMTSASPSSIATPAGNTTVSPSANGTVTDNVTAIVASSATAELSTTYGNTTEAVFSTTYEPTTEAVLSTTYEPTTAAVPSTTYEPTTVTSSTSATTINTSQLKDQTNITPIVVLAVVIPILVLVIIAGVLFFYRKRLKSLCGVKKEGDAISETSLALPSYTSLVVNTDEFLDYINDMEKECDFRYAQQFESLQLVGREQTTDQALLKCNVEKNRYINIHPYDITRVKLLPVESEDGSDYVNASWIPGYYSKREYIAAQGPLPATEDDMWRMIWEYKCKGIIMLTKCMEGGRKKCDQYWPEDMEPVVYGDIQVVLVSESSEEGKWTIKKLELSVGQQKRTIKFFHFIEWPDNGVPQSPEVLLEFMQVVKTELETAKAGPLVIHCSAGVGRTGTYIAIETLLLQLENERQVDVFGIVYRLRLNRVFMVQTEVQFKFIHETIGHVIRKQNENEVLSEDAKLLNHNDLQPATDPEEVQMNDIQVSTYKASGVKGIDNPGFEFSSQT